MHVSPRRDFLGRLGAAATGLAGSSAFPPVPGTHPPRRNPFWSAPAASPRAHDRSTLDALLGRGATLLVCNIAAMNWAARLAQKLERDVEETRNQVRNGLVPGAILVPSGIFALIRAQNAGCAFMRGA